MAKKIVNLFVIWVLAGTAAAFFYPSYFSSHGNTIVPVLGLVMFGMGVTLRLEDFKAVFRMPKAVLVGVFAQFFWMPLIGWGVATALRLDPQLAAGEVLVGSCPGGTASNVLTFLAGGDVALAVTMTAVTTLCSPLVTPFLMYAYAHAWVQVPVWGIFLKTLQIMIVPIGFGIVLRKTAGKFEDRLIRWMPGVSVAGIVWIIAVIVASNRANLLEVGGKVFLAVALHNVLGLVLGYWTARLFGLGAAQVRAISIEVAVHDSGLGVALAKTFFGAAAALPSAVFSVWQNLSGPVAAWFFRRWTRDGTGA